MSERTYRCSKCRLNKPAEEFNLSRKAASGLQGYCKACSRARSRRFDPVKKRAYWLKRCYNITIEAYAALLKEQDGGCAICGQEPGQRALHVDHDHATGQVRGLLCYNCNVGLGQFKDHAGVLMAAVGYLMTAKDCVPGGSHGGWARTA